MYREPLPTSQNDLPQTDWYHPGRRLEDFIIPAPKPPSRHKKPAPPRPDIFSFRPVNEEIVLPIAGAPQYIHPDIGIEQFRNVANAPQIQNQFQDIFEFNPIGPLDDRQEHMVYNRIQEELGIQSSQRPLNRPDEELPEITDRRRNILDEINESVDYIFSGNYGVNVDLAPGQEVEVGKKGIFEYKDVDSSVKLNTLVLSNRVEEVFEDPKKVTVEYAQYWSLGVIRRFINEVNALFRGRSSPYVILTLMKWPYRIKHTTRINPNTGAVENDPTIPPISERVGEITYGVAQYPQSFEVIRNGHPIKSRKIQLNDLRRLPDDALLELLHMKDAEDMGYVTVSAITEISFYSTRGHDTTNEVQNVLTQQRQHLQQLLLFDSDVTSSYFKREYSHYTLTQPNICIFESLFITTYFERKSDSIVPRPTRNSEYKELLMRNFNRLPYHMAEHVKHGRVFEFYSDVSIDYPENRYVILEAHSCSLHTFVDGEHSSRGCPIEFYHKAMKEYRECMGILYASPIMTKRTGTVLEWLKENKDCANYRISNAINKIMTLYDEFNKNKLDIAEFTPMPRTYYFIAATEDEFSNHGHIMPSTFEKLRKYLMSHKSFAKFDQWIEDGIKFIIPGLHSIDNSHNPVIMSSKVKDASERREEKRKKLTKAAHEQLDKLVSKRISTHGAVEAREYQQKLAETIPDKVESMLPPLRPPEFLTITYDLEASYILIQGSSGEEKFQIPILACVQVNHVICEHKPMVLSSDKCYFYGLNCLRELVDYLYSFSTSALEGKEVADSHRMRNPSVVERQLPTYVITFNGTSYDNILIYNDLKSKIPKTHFIGSISSLKSLTAENLKFFDMKSHSVGTLNKVAEDLLGIKEAKEDFNLARIPMCSIDENGEKHFSMCDSDFQDLLSYCEQDVNLTFDVTMKHIENITAIKHSKTGRSLTSFDVLNTPTLAGLSYKMCKKCFPPSRTLRSCAPWLETLTRKAYYGGVCNAYQTYSRHNKNGSKIIGFDRNSSYSAELCKLLPYEPQSIFNKELVLRKNSKGGYCQDGEGSSYLRDFIQEPEKYLFVVKAFSFADASRSAHNKPCIPIRHGTLGNYYPRNAFDAKLSGDILVCWGQSVKLALDEGATFVVTSIIKWKSAILFADYITTLYNMRCSVKKENPSLAATLKNLMNSFYGRMGMNISSSTITVDTDDELGRLIENEEIVSVVRSKDVPGRRYITFKTDIINRKNDSGHLVHIAGCVTDGARVSLMKGTYDIENNTSATIAYSDTDSLVVDYPEDKRDDLKPFIDMDEVRLGAWKIEKVIADFIALAPKLYSGFVEELGKEAKWATHAKGITEKVKRHTPDGITTTVTVKHSDFEQMAANLFDNSQGKSQTIAHIIKVDRTLNGVTFNENYKRAIDKRNTKRTIINPFTTEPPDQIIPPTQHHI